MTQLYDCRDTFENKLRELAAEDQRIVAVVNDSVGSSKLNQFGQMYPVRRVNVGIAAQNMMMVAKQRIANQDLSQIRKSFQLRNVAVALSSKVLFGFAS